jgi:CNT family concentrative nucleoside transporter
MSAPAALAVSKIVYPETEVSATADGGELVIEGNGAGNVIEAAAQGASDAVGLCGNIGGWRVLLDFVLFVFFCLFCLF